MTEIGNIRRKPSGAAVLSRYEIDSMASEIVYGYCPEMKESPRPLSVMGLVGDYIKAPLTTEKIIPIHDALGLTTFERDENNLIRATITIDSDLFHDDKQSGRCRFTIGHECAHYLLHGPFFIDLKERGNEDDPAVQRDIRITEWQANVFASSLLMPKDAVKEISCRYGDIEDEALRTALMIVCTSSTFDVSVQAAVIRMKELGILSRNCKIDYEEIRFVQQFNTGLRMRRKYLS